MEGNKAENKGAGEREAVDQEVMKQNVFFTISDEELSQVKPVVPINPTVYDIRKQLSFIPAQIEYIDDIKLEQDTVVQKVKLLIKGKNKNLEIQKSKIRQDEINKWKEEMKDYLPNVKKLFADFENDPNMNKIMMQQLIKDLKPEKPTKNDLDDIATLRTEGLQKEIYQLEKYLNELIKHFDSIKIRKDNYENAFITVRAHARLLERQYGKIE